MASYDYLIAGLGNPGDKYAGSRHNIGWMVANAFCIEHDLSWKKLSNIYLGTEFKYAGKNVFMCLPTTYMNNSGEALKKISDKHHIPVENILTIVDEYNFSVGKIHLKSGGSNGGHNGLASVIRELGDDKFMRLRCGIGKDFVSGGMVEYVLSDFPKEQNDEVIKMIDKSIDAIECLLKNGFSRTMSLVNSGKLWEEEKENGRDS